MGYKNMHYGIQLFIFIVFSATINFEVSLLSNNVVRYNNGLNGVALRTFTSVDMDLFWSICSKMKRKETNEATFTFEEIKEISKYSQRGTAIFANDVIKMADKLGSLAFYFEDENVWERLNLFQRFLVDKEKEILTVKVNEQFEFILNSIGTNFTRFELENMTKLSGSYTKEIYRQLMAHRDFTTRRGAWFIKIEDFREILSIPDSYRMTDIDRQILKVAHKELTAPDVNGISIFSSFKIEKIKARKGNRISSFRFYFQEPLCPTTIPVPVL